MWKKHIKMWTVCQTYRKDLEKIQFKTFYSSYDTLQLQACYIAVGILVKKGLKP